MSAPVSIVLNFVDLISPSLSVFFHRHIVISILLNTCWGASADFYYFLSHAFSYLCYCPLPTLFPLDPSTRFLQLTEFVGFYLPAPWVGNSMKAISLSIKGLILFVSCLSKITVFIPQFLTFKNCCFACTICCSKW